MNSLFSAQPIAFQSFDAFPLDISPIQQQMITGNGLDMAFKQAAAEDTSLQPASRIKKYFSTQSYQYFVAPASSSVELDIKGNEQGNYQSQAAFAGASYARNRQLVAAATGKQLGLAGLQFAKATLSLATHAGTQQMMQVQAPKNAGVLRTTFAINGNNPAVQPQVSLLNRFMDGPQLRETLFNYGVGAEHAFGDKGVDAQVLDRLQPGSSIAAEAAMIEDATLGRKMVEGSVSGKYRFQRLMPSFSRFGQSQIDIVNRIANQHRHANGFKPRVSSRF